MVVGQLLTVLRAFNIGEFVHGKAQQPLPQAIRAYEAEIDQFADLCRQLCTKLLGLFAIGLKVCGCSDLMILKNQIHDGIRSMRMTAVSIGSPLGMPFLKVLREVFSGSSM